MYKSYIPYLQHILEECLYIRSVITDDMVIDQFLVDETLKRAVTRSLSTLNSQLETSLYESPRTFIVLQPLSTCGATQLRLKPSWAGTRTRLASKNW